MSDRFVIMDNYLSSEGIPIISFDGKGVPSSATFTHYSLFDTEEWESIYNFTTDEELKVVLSLINIVNKQLTEEVDA